MEASEDPRRNIFLLFLPYLDTMETTGRFEMVMRADTIGRLSKKSVEWKN